MSPTQQHCNNRGIVEDDEATLRSSELEITSITQTLLWVEMFSKGAKQGDQKQKRRDQRSCSQPSGECKGGRIPVSLFKYAAK